MTKRVIRLTETDLHRVVKTCVKNLLQEAKDDNLHEFIQYIVSHGKQGELRSSFDDPYNDFMWYIDVSKSAYFNDIVDQHAEWYCYDNDIDEEEEWTEEIYNDFAIWCNNKATDSICDYIETNQNNCIYIERAITIPKFADKNKLYDWFKKDYNGHLGVYWSYRRNFAEPYWGNNNQDTVILKGYVRPEDVDWLDTLSTYLYNVEEYELRLKPNAPIQVVEIVTEEGNHKIFRGNLILQA